MSLFQSNFSKSLISVATIFGLVTIGNFISTAPTGAFTVNFSNGGFESSTTDWTTIGDVTTNTGIDSVNPISGTTQAIITNSYITAGDRIDDNFTFNQSGTNPVDADTITTNHTGNDLQTSLGLDTYDLSIDRIPLQTGFPRTSKEGSAIYQDITVTISEDDVLNGTNGFSINYNWAYLTNDGADDTYGLGNQDYSFISIVDTSTSSGTVTVLGDSSNPLSTITAPTGDNNYVETTTDFYTATNFDSQQITGLGAGEYTYRVGFGVVDVDGYDRTSTLLLDNFSVQQAVPFDFSPSAGIIGIIGCLSLRRLKQKFLPSK